VAGLVDTDAARRAWDDALAVPAWSGPDVWIHGDMHPANLLVIQGRLAAVVDFGDLAVGDPATDLIVAWMLPPPWDPRRLREAVGVDDDTWARGRGWAITLGLAMVANSADNPLIAGIGHRALAAALAPEA
ncbi:MAG TPA: phosphotransferase, partial [Acidimicrobiales bacterium]|nr:phosphotransferase [Acidimicrobiales bacterium]